MPEPKPYQCRHIFLDGHRCGSPSLRLEAFCYYHHATRRPLKLSEAQLHQEQIDDWDIPNLEDRPSIQLALTRTLRRLAGNRLHFQAAKLLIYGLQVASQNLAKMEAAAREEEQTPTRVEAIEHHPEQGPIAQEKELETGCPMITDLKAEAEAEAETESEASGDRGDTPASGYPQRSRLNPPRIKTLDPKSGVPQTAPGHPDAGNVFLSKTSRSRLSVYSSRVIASKSSLSAPRQSSGTSASACEIPLSTIRCREQAFESATTTPPIC